MKNNYKLICIILVLLLVSASLLIGCDDDEPYITIIAPNQEEVSGNDVTADDVTADDATNEDVEVLEGLGEVEFDELMDEMFETWVTRSTIMLNNFLVDPESMGIERPEPSFGDVLTIELIREDMQEYREFVEHFSEFNFYLLRPDQQIVYEILYRSIRIHEGTPTTEEMYFFHGYIRPIRGIQVSLPIILSNFIFHTVDDIEEYLQLLPDIVRYFDEIIEFERERARRGFFLSDANVDRVIEQLEDFIESRYDSMLVATFNDRVDAFTELSEERREQYKARNERYVLEYFYPAYDTLLEAMRELRSIGPLDGGLASLPGGSEYAARSIQMSVGTDRDADELRDLLGDWIDMTWASIIQIVQSDSELADRFIAGEAGQLPDRTPDEIVEILRLAMEDDFPPIGEIDFTVNEIHESLREHASPAFFNVPAFDGFEHNVIYINPTRLDDSMLLFTILAHESYPGHMYQIVYFLQTSPHPVRTVIRNLGYTEGWATYAEMLSYFFTELSEEEAALLWYWHFLTNYLLGSFIDMGVNVFGWGEEQVEGVLSIFGFDSPETVEAFYNSVTANPLTMLDYSLGLIELLELRFFAENELGADFELLEFHRFFLDMGPAPFPIIRTHMYDWIETQN